MMTPSTMSETASVTRQLLSAPLPQIIELNIGHFLVGEAIFVGLDAAIREMRRLMDAARGIAA